LYPLKRLLLLENRSASPIHSTLPLRLQVACMNWGIVRQTAPALLRLAGDEIRAIVSGRYAAADDGMLLQIVADLLDRGGYRDDVRVLTLATGPYTLLRITLPNEGAPIMAGDIIEHGDQHWPPRQHLGPRGHRRRCVLPGDPERAPS
jgi:hypothetical protein